MDSVDRHTDKSVNEELKRFVYRMTRRNKERLKKINENRWKKVIKNGEIASVYNMRLARACAAQHAVLVRISFVCAQYKTSEMLYACYMHCVHSEPLQMVCSFSAETEKD